MTAEIRLLRHAETAGYEGDLGLSDRGRAQARERRPNWRPRRTARSRWCMRRACAPASPPRCWPRSWRRERGGRRPAGGAGVRELHGRGRRRRPRAGGGVRRVRRRGGRRSRSCPAGWRTSRGSAPSTSRAGTRSSFWLKTPLLGFEPPAVAVRRYWRAIAACPTSPSPSSPPTRARCARSSPTPSPATSGSRENLEAVVIHLEGCRGRVGLPRRDRRHRRPRSGRAPLVVAAPAAHAVRETADQPTRRRSLAAWPSRGVRGPAP